MANSKIIIEVSAKDMASGALNGVNVQINELANTAKTSGSSMSGFKNFLGGMFQTAAGFIAANVFGKITSAISDFATGTLEAGANLQRLKIATEVVAKNSNISKEEIDGMVEALADTNTFGANAYNAIYGFTRNGLLPMVKELKTVDKTTGKTKEGFDAFIGTTKDLAASMGISSSDAIERVSRVLTTLNDEALQQLGISVNLRSVFDKYAKTLGKSADELTEVEKRQALLNIIMEQGAVVAGTYTATYETAGKNLISIKDALESTQQEIGLIISENGFAGLTNKVLESVKAFRELFRGNSAIKTKLQELTKLISDKLLAAFDKLMGVITRLGENPSVQKFFSNTIDFVIALGTWTIDGIINSIDFMAGIFEDIAPTLNDVWATFQELWDLIANDPALQEAFKEIGDTLRGAFSEGIKVILNTVKNIIVDLIAQLKTPDGKQALKNFADALKVIADAAGILLVALANVLSLVVQLVTWFAMLQTKQSQAIANQNKIKPAENNYTKDLGELTIGGLKGNISELNFATGTDYFQGGLTMVGEKGPELVNLPKGSAITSYGETQTAVGGGGITININGAQNPMDIAREVERVLARRNQSARMGLNLGI